MTKFDAKKFLEEFQNRPIYKELSLEILAAIPDDELEQAIIDYISTKLTDYRTTLADVSRMAPGFQIVYSTWVLEAEVDNGGFNQFFFNLSGQFANMALESLKMIGATDYYEILQKAMEQHTQENETSPLQDLYSQRTLQAFSESYELTSLGKYDEAFWQLRDRLGELRVQYIRSHPDEFVGS